MAKVKHPTQNRNYLVFMCPGCNQYHTLKVAYGSSQDGWYWNEDYDAPTFKPSVLSNSEHSNPEAPLCHSFITDGKIRFLHDSDHSLAGCTVDLPEVG